MKKLLFILAGLLLTITACQAAPAEPVVVTVVQTQLVPATVIVEATRIVEVVQTVETTRLVEVVVTATPEPTQPPTATPTQTPVPLGGGSTTGGSNFTAPDNALPTEKVSGVSVLKVINETRDTLVVSIQGAKSLRLQISGKTSGLWIIPEGQYTYQVFRDGVLLYGGTMSLTNPDKHDLVLKEDKAVFRVP